MAQKAEVPYLALLGDCKDFLLLCGLFVLGGIGPLRFEGNGVEAAALAGHNNIKLALI